MAEKRCGGEGEFFQWAVEKNMLAGEQTASVSKEKFQHFFAITITASICLGVSRKRKAQFLLVSTLEI